MTTREGPGATPPAEATGSADRDHVLLTSLVLLGLFMTSVLAFGALVVAVSAGLSHLVTAVVAILWLGTAVVGAPLMLYDAHAIRGHPAAGGFRFDPFWTGVALFFVYPIGLPVYLVARMNGSYVAVIDEDPDQMDLGDEFEFGVRDLVNPTAGGVPSVWPTVLVLVAWFCVLFGDGAVAVGAISGDPSALIAGLGVALVVRGGATVALLFDLYLVGKTGFVDRREAAGLAVVTAVLYPVAAVGYVPYRLWVTYG